MLQNKVIKETIKKYIKLKGFDTEFNKLKDDLVNYCVDYIKSTVPQEIQDLAASGKTKSVIYQEDLYLYYYYSQKLLGTGSNISKYRAADKYFNLCVFEFKKYSLPRFFDLEDITGAGDTEEGKAFRKEYKEFVKTFKEKYLTLVDYAYEKTKKLEALEKVLLNEKATLTTIKANYIELYNLIKS